jgi:phosphoribosyl 1,2-cyclic phosphodiesterase
MTITLWGVRGSIPTTSPDTKHFGGNTSCIQVEADGWCLILDAGTGIQYVNRTNNLNTTRIDILLTHLHIDHIQGLGFFKPLFDPTAEVHIWGPASSTQNLRARLGRYFSPPLFPVYFSNLACKLFLHEIENSTFNIGPFTITSGYVIHPGPTIGFRLEADQKAVTYLPDHEPAIGPGELVKDIKWLSGGDLAFGVDLLIHDAQYTAEEYKNRVGWGHSSMEDAVQYAALMNVKHLLLTHHDPMRSDRQLHEIFKGLRRHISSSLSIELAVEGKKINL